MSTAWNHYPSSFTDAPREFLVTVELYISNAAGASLRKPLSKNKKLDKRESTGDDLRLKEKSSSNWLNLQKGLSGAGHWRTATCRLSEEGERCLLNVYVDESILFQTVYIHLLNQTDIRPTDASLFYRKDCLGIFSIAGQRWTPSHTAEPLYLQFPNPDTFATWQALLKSYAIPEIYGRWFFPLDGGSYRMWRQVEVTVVSGRNMGASKPDSSANNRDDKDDGDGLDVDVSCEVQLNDILCSRTTVKKGLGTPEWHETFTFPGLPPFEHLDIIVWQNKKLYKPSILGTTRVALGNFRRGDVVEGWFPVLQPGGFGTEIQVGDLRLKLRVDEEIILPYSSYAGLISVCSSRNFLDWMADLENRMKLKNISNHLMSIAIANNTVVEQVKAYASREIDKSSNSHQTLFRGNTILSKTMEICMNWYGKSFLEASIGPVIRRICADKIAIEVDPLRSGKGTKDVEKNVDQLVYWCQEFWKQIYAVRADCPNEMRILFKTVRRLVEQRYRPDPVSIDVSNNNLPWQSVSAFIFLRFIVPAILHPHLFGLCAGLPPPLVSRSLTLIAKVIQSLANLNSNSQKETFMRGVQGFVEDSLPAMIDYIVVVSTPISEAPSSNHGGDDFNRHDRLNVVNALRQRTKNMTVLDREAVPILPHLLDIPKHLAIITSAVIRSSRDLSARARTGDVTDVAVDEFCSKCFEVEEEALSRVSQLATRLATESRRPSVQDISADKDDEAPHSPRSTVTSTVVSTSPPPVSRRRKSSRPSTAPSPSGSDSASSRRQMFFSENPLTSPRAFARTVQAEQQRTWNGLGHTKAPSTDSFPILVRDAKPTPLRLLQPPETPTEKDDETGKRKKGLLRGILRR